MDASKPQLKELLQEPARLAELVSYQNGSVVSRALVAREAGTVTLFAFAGGQELSEHTAPYDALVILLEGDADITVAGQLFRVRGGETLLLPAHKPHALRAATPFKMLLVMIRA